MKETKKQLGDENEYRKEAFKDRILSQLVDYSKRFFKNVKVKGYIMEKDLKYFTYEFKKSCNVGKLYLLLKIYEIFNHAPGRPVISNFGMPTEKV